MRKNFFLLVFLLLVPLAIASTVNTNKEIYTPSESVTITITGCSGSSILTVLNPTGEAVFSDQGDNNWQTFYHTSSDPSTGTYTINAVCGAEEFLITFKVEEETTEDEPTPTTHSNGGGTGGSTGGKCTPEWSCGLWSYCGLNLTQTRTCTDLKYCLPIKTEIKPCLVCDESWVCSVWSSCIAGKQTRLCTEEHLCGTILKKPIIQKVCNSLDTGFPPARIVPPPKLAETSFWDEYKLWIILIPIILILLALAIFIYFHFYGKPKEAVSNIDELKKWVGRSKAKGVPEEKIREIVHQKTRWTDKELNQVFKELKE
jgi:hypothetical protein